MSLGVLIAQIDTSVVNLAVKPIGTDLKASVTKLQWIVDVYNFIYASLLLTAGTLPQDLKMPTLKISAQYREPPMLIVPSAAGFLFVFKPAMRTRGLCRLSTTLGIAMTAAVLWIAWLRPCFRAEVRSASARESPAIATGLARQQRPSLDCGVRVVEARKRDVFGAAGV
jgi:hypothetical protein